MGNKRDDAFQSLIASVPGVDTSGFVKRSMNEQKAASKKTSTKPVPIRKPPEKAQSRETYGGQSEGSISCAGPSPTLAGSYEEFQRKSPPSIAPSTSASVATAAQEKGSSGSPNLGAVGVRSPSPARPSTPLSAQRGEPLRRAGNQGKPEAAFQSLIASVPGVDTSGFIKRSMNELKGDGGSDVSPPKVSIGEQPAVDRWASPRSESLVAPPSSSVASIPASELDHLGVPSPKTMPAGTVTGIDDLFDGIPGVQAPVVPARRLSPSPPLVGGAAEPAQGTMDGDLLGLGSQDISNKLDSLRFSPQVVGSPTGVSRRYDLEDNRTEADVLDSEASPLSATYAPPTQEARDSAGAGWSSRNGHPFGDASIPVSVDLQHDSYDSNTQSGTPTPSKEELQADPGEWRFGSLDPYDSGTVLNSVDKEGGPASKKKSGNPKLGRLSKAAAKELKKGLGKFQRGKGTDPESTSGKPSAPKNKEHKWGSKAAQNKGKSSDPEPVQGEQTLPPPKAQKGGLKAVQHKAKKYRNNFSKVALQWSHRGLEAMKQGLEAAQDWVDKGIEARKKQEEGKVIKTHELDLESSNDLDVGASQHEETIKDAVVDDMAGVVEIAAELQKLEPEDRAFALNEMDPGTRVKIVELLKSQDIEVIEVGSPIQQGNAETKGDNLVGLVEIAAELQKLTPEDRVLALNEMDHDIRDKIVELLRSQGIQVLDNGQQELVHEVYGLHQAVEPPPPPPTAFAQPPLAQMHRAVSDNAVPDLQDTHPWGPDVSHGHINAGQVPDEMPGTPMSVQRSASLPDMHDNLLDACNQPKSPARGFGARMTAAAVVNNAFGECATDPDELDSFFQGAHAVVAPAKDSPQVPRMDDFFTGQSENHAGAPPKDLSHGVSNPPKMHENLADFRGMEAPVDGTVGTHSEVYAGDNAQEGEPEERKIFRERRIQEKQAKIEAALQEKVLREHSELERQEAQAVYKAKHSPKIQAWKDHHRANIRGMLTSLHTVLWEGANWKPISVGDVLDAGQVKRAYMKANLLVHPDKVRQKNGTDEHVVIADMVFDALKEAWTEFQT